MQEGGRRDKARDQDVDGISQRTIDAYAGTKKRGSPHGNTVDSARVWRFSHPRSRGSNEALDTRHPLDTVPTFRTGMIS